MTDMQFPLQMLARLLPASWRGRIREYGYSALGLDWTLNTGISIHLRSQSDWIAFSDIFLNSEYDEAILQAISVAQSDGLCVLDLGGNSGFFVQRLVDKLCTTAPNLTSSIVTVEGSPRNFERLRFNLAGLKNIQSCNVTPVHGLVGDRNGTGHIREGAFNSMNSVGPGGTAVSYVDVSKLVDLWPRIDLLKCDIEGSELQFVRGYPAILQKTQLAVFEFHDAEGPATLECRDTLARCGLSNRKLLRTYVNNTVELFWR